MMQKMIINSRSFIARVIAKPAFKNLIEIIVVIIWSIWVGRVYLNFSPDVIPSGGEFLMGIQSHFIWRLLKECGSCFFWNGFTNGGTPAFVETHGAWLHPLVALPALLFDVISGAKITMVLGLMLAGLAQWWLSHILKIGSISRLWSSMLVVVSGHIAGKMDMGLVPLVTSVASCSLVIPPALDLAINGRRHTAIILAVTLALAIVSGQGYLQIGLLVTVFPALLILLVDEKNNIKPQWKYFVLAMFLALLLSGVFLVPLLHFGLNYGKDMDPVLDSWQPVKFLLLNLLIDDPEFYFSRILLKLPYPYLYVNYIGWIPTIFAIFGLTGLFTKDKKLGGFFVIAISLVYLAASGLTFKLFGLISPQIMFAIRNPSFIASLAVPLILALAAMGTDSLLNKKNTWLVLSEINNENQKSIIKFNYLWIVIIPMGIALISSIEFSDNWMRIENVVAKTENLISELQTPSSQWVQPPFGEAFWLLPAMDSNIKIADYFRPWQWKDREKPKPFLSGFRQQPLPEEGNLMGVVDDVYLTHSPQNEYAIVRTSTDDIPCIAAARGGSINVDCTTEQQGMLIVQENSWKGWSVKMDGKPSSLILKNWLSTNAPAGNHHYEFRYLPWDVPLGVMLTILGIIIAVWYWLKYPDSNQMID